MASSHYEIVGPLLACIVVVLALTKVYHAVNGPLASLPGPRYTKWTRLRLKAAVMSGQRVFYVHALHVRYGPVVRISPDEVAVSDVRAAKTIHRVGSSFQKTTWYAKVAGDKDVHNLFSMVDQRVHAHHRRLQAANFAESWVKRMEPMIMKNVHLTIANMHEEFCRQGHFDAFKWFFFMATDVIGEAAFGESFKMLESGQKNEYYNDILSVGPRGLTRAEFPFLAQLMSHVPFGSAGEAIRGRDRQLVYSQELIQRYWNQLKVDPENAKPTLLTKLYKNVEEGLIAPAQLRRDGSGYLTAGTDTTAIFATYIVWKLAKNPEVQAALVEEISCLPDDFTDDDLHRISLLSNVINETLRLHGPANATLPRKVPSGGTQICGYSIPEDITVGTQAYTLHRNPMVWHDPDSFDPSRWNSPTKEMKESFMPFGGGSRVCIGMHFALMELRHAIASFYRTFPTGVTVSSAEGFNDEVEMKQSEYFLMPPSGKFKRCLLTSSLVKSGKTGL